MPYKLIKIEKKDSPEGTNYVALVQQDEQEQPFRIQLDNFESMEEAKGQVDAWIAVREEEDAMRIKNQEQEAQVAKQDSIIDEINKSL